LVSLEAAPSVSFLYLVRGTKMMRLVLEQKNT